MSPELTTILMFLSLLVLLTGFPLAFGIASMGILFGYLTGGNAFLYMIPQRVINGTLSEYILAAVPLFIFMGVSISSSGVAERSFIVLQRWMSSIRGGLAIATITLAIVFAACVGVVGASVTAIGILAIPAMQKARYADSLATGVVCAGGTLGILIPPSIMLILYAPIAGVSVVDMYAGAVVPGLLLGILYIVYVILRTKFNPEMGPSLPKEMGLKFFSRESLVQGFKYLAPPVLLVILVMGSLFLGIASPTEAGAVGSVGAIALGFIYRTITWQSFKNDCYLTLRITAMIIFIAIAASLFTGAFLNAGCGQVITDVLLGLGLGRWGIFIAVLIIVLILGCFIDWIGILLIMVPIFAPILTTLKFDPLWVGLVVCTSLQVSFLSPPFAYSIFYAKAITPKTPLTDIYRGVMPFVAIQLLVTMLCIIFPALCLWLPNLLSQG
ncbi:MAG: Sialic acid TRAP transporter permease protein SiaT [Smithella sp. PtaU1.Bin162]|nr:MAG: Sialic acid TRAP transporter permease protein SiaT [Smithella sp. PtaU1.Bin162]